MDCKTKSKNPEIELPEEEEKELEWSIMWTGSSLKDHELNQI